jgi:hypothetical protein
MKNLDIQTLVSAVVPGNVTILASRPLEFYYFPILAEHLRSRFDRVTIVTTEPDEPYWPTDLPLQVIDDWQSPEQWETYASTSDLIIVHGLRMDNHNIGSIVRRSPNVALLALVLLGTNVEERDYKRPLESDFDNLLPLADFVGNVYTENFYTCRDREVDDLEFIQVK